MNEPKTGGASVPLDCAVGQDCAADFAIWWTAEDDCFAIGEASDLPAAVPDYVRTQYTRRLGRNGRGRLWSDWDFGTVDPWPNTRICRAARNCAGIVMLRKNAGTVSALPGFLTDFDMQWLVLPNTN